MSEQQHPPTSSLLAIQTLEEHIRQEAPYLHVMDVLEFPRPFVKVWDTVNGIVVGFSSEADYRTYCQIVHREVRRHA